MIKIMKKRLDEVYRSVVEGEESVDTLKATLSKKFTKQKSGGADWVVDAWLVGDDFDGPGKIYIVDNEDGTFSFIVREFDEVNDENKDTDISEPMEAEEMISYISDLRGSELIKKIFADK